MRTVRKGWMRYDAHSKWNRVLVDDRGFAFQRGDGWRKHHGSEFRILPVPIPITIWPSSEWWAPRLWRRPEWAWIYGAP
jgi:hypothetical protein